MADVAAAVRALAARCDVVLVSGDGACARDGGPALAGVAHAFGLRLVSCVQPGAPVLPEGAELQVHDAADAPQQALVKLSIASSIVFVALGDADALRAHVEAVCAYIDAARCV
jgi:hypothetical protein